ncbi:hypothetical protein VTN00DRAFT_10253 [Thermoascus crustaceus]|uniref:uncharacterized protein n=1 Tax=Thermoascus crustaceus TaxID=5088 RepID=UPI00374334A1
MVSGPVAWGLATTAAAAALSAARGCQSSLLSRSAATSKLPIPILRKSTPLPSSTLSSLSQRPFTPSPFPATTSHFFSTSATQQRYQTLEERETPSINTTPDGESLPYYSPYKPKRQWPPDMSKLSPKHQFRLERKYRRRAALKYARPKWSKGTKLVQWGVIGFVLLYAVLFMEWDTNDNPFEEIRKELFSGVNSMFSSPQPPIPSPGKRAADESRQ